jgi:thioredoxin 1
VSEVTQENYHNLVENSDKTVLLDVWAPWCAPCKLIEPVIDELARAFEGRLEVAKLNVEEQGNLASHIGVSGLPTIRLMRGGAVLYQAVGLVDRQRLTAAVTGAMQGAR